MDQPLARTEPDRRRNVKRFDEATRPADPIESSHGVERQVRCVLTSHPGLSFSSLVVHRVRGGVCLTGVVESSDGDPDVCGLARQVAGVNEVLNRLIVRGAISG